MSESVIHPKQFSPYLHGTAGPLEGNEVSPSTPKAYSNPAVADIYHPDQLKALLKPAAYGTTVETIANSSAGRAAENEGRLFGSVYEVEPRVVVGVESETGKKHGVPSPTGSWSDIADPEGLDVVKHSHFVDHKGHRL
jgi:hypothetical protein